MTQESFRVLTLTDPSLLQGSKWDRWLVWFPIVGWTLGYAMQAGRAGKVIRAVRSQLAERSRFPSAAWAQVGVDPVVAERVAVVIAETIVWPNHYFLPDDPCALLLVDEEGMGLFTTAAIEAAFRIRLDRIEVRVAQTFAQLLAAVTRHLPAV